MYHSMEFWQMLHRGELKPMSTHNGQVKYSSTLYKRFYSTTRVPGIEVDHIKRYFKTSKRNYLNLNHYFLKQTEIRLICTN